MAMGRCFQFLEFLEPMDEAGTELTALASSPRCSV
jgi:hypothetical protein